jgi:hypothetical protein
MKMKLSGIHTNVLEEPTALIFYPEDGSSRFL